MIISIGRQSGSGGREIATKLSKTLGIKYFNEDLLIEEAGKLGYFEQMYEFYKESPVNTLMQAIALNENTKKRQAKISQIYHEIIDNKDCVIIGRCANHFLKDLKEFYSVFLYADLDFKLSRLSKEGFSKEKALEYMEKNDSARSSFHKYYSKENWGDPSNYDLCIKTSKKGINHTTQLILNYINKSQ